MSLYRIAFRLRGAHCSLTIPTMGQFKDKVLLLVPIFRQAIVFLFFFLLPTQLARHFWPTWAYVQGIRIDYLSPTIAVIDILSFTIVIFHISTLVHIIRTSERTILVTLGLLILTNVLFSTLPIHTLLSWVRIVVRICVALVIVKERERYLSPILMGLSIGTVMQFVLVCTQFVHQSSLQGVWYWLGERKVVLSLPDVAKISVYGREYLRPYGTFSHPNALGGFYVLLFFFVYWLKQQMPPGRAHVFANVILFICPFIVLVSFSKVAIVSFVLGSLLLVWSDYTYRKCALCLVARTSILVLMFLMFTIPIGDPYSLQKRIVLIINSVQIFINHPLWGVGLGTYIIAQSTLSVLPRYMPLFQPVHNVFLLIVTEMGVGGLLLIYAIVREVRLAAFGRLGLVTIIVTVLMTGMFDHYWITQSQTQMLLIFVVLSIFLIRPAMANELKKRPM